VYRHRRLVACFDVVHGHDKLNTANRPLYASKESCIQGDDIRVLRTCNQYLAQDKMESEEQLPHSIQEPGHRLRQPAKKQEHFRFALVEIGWRLATLPILSQH
jgi:hypothetical protein